MVSIVLCALLEMWFFLVMFNCMVNAEIWWSHMVLPSCQKLWMSNITILNIPVWYTSLLVILSNSWPLPYGISRYFSPCLLLFYIGCVMSWYMKLLCCTILRLFTAAFYCIWFGFFCLIPLALCCSWKLFLLAQKKYVPLSSIRLDVAAKLENKRNKKNERENEK